MLQLYFQTNPSSHLHEEGRAMLHDLLHRFLPGAPAVLRIEQGAFGKPFLPDYPLFHFNLSHTRGIIVCAVSDRPVGVDVEGGHEYRPLVVARCFTPAEQAYVGEDSERFREVWTKKEAFVKYTGDGLTCAFSSFDVLNMPCIATCCLEDFRLSVCGDRITPAFHLQPIPFI